jgi:predicted metal-dependent hydrolase
MDGRLRQGIDLFNGGKFFESHEVLEEVYRDSAEENKAFLEGLIGLAAAFRLFRDFQEIKGPVRMIYQALIRLENYQPAFLNIDVDGLCRAAEAWAKSAEAGKIDPANHGIPQIKVQRFRLFS